MKKSLMAKFRKYVLQLEQLELLIQDNDRGSDDYSKKILLITKVRSTLERCDVKDQEMLLALYPVLKELLYVD